jgi:hypothetical protein
MKSTLLLWTTTHGTWFHFRKEESLLNADGYIEQIFFHMVRSTSTNIDFFTKGHSQVHGIDYTEIFAPVAKMDSIRLVLAIATSRRWEVHHMH